MICLTSTIHSISDNDKTEALLSNIANNDSSAFSELYEQIKDAVYAYALSFLKNSHDAEDVMHDCFVSIWKNARFYKNNGKPMAWIFTITRNLCLDKYRLSRRMADIPEEDWEQYLSEKNEISTEDKILLHTCLEKLSTEENEILFLHAVSGLKHKETAELMHLSLSTVLSKYNRAIKKLQKLLAMEDECT